MSADSELKYAIANAIFSQPESKPFNFKAIDAQKHGGIQSIVFQRDGNLSTRIRVKTQRNGTHWYTLSLKEER